MSEKRKRPTYTNYTKEFKQDAVKLVVEPKIHRLKKDMGIGVVRRSIFSKISEKAPDITVTL